MQKYFHNSARGGYQGGPPRQGPPPVNHQGNGNMAPPNNQSFPMKRGPPSGPPGPKRGILSRFCTPRFITMNKIKIFAYLFAFTGRFEQQPVPQQHRPQKYPPQHAPPPPPVHQQNHPPQYNNSGYHNGPPQQQPPPQQHPQNK